MKALLLGLAASLLLTNAAAQQAASWSHLTSTRDGDEIHVDVTSYQRTPESILTVRFRIVSARGAVTLARFAIARETCDRGEGAVFVSDLRETTPVRTAYVKNGGSVASIIGDLVCDVETRNRR